MRILIAEDNPINEGVARKLLGRLGHSCVNAWNGREVLEILRAGERFDCILMDIQMPEMDGLEATRRIREEYPLVSQRPPIVALTANAFASDREACFAAGMVGFIAKPLRMATLQEALDRIANPPGDAADDLEPPRPAGDIDFEQFDSIIDGGDEEAIEIFEEFCSDIPVQLSRMETFAKVGDAAEFAGMAHQLKGSCAMFGLVEFSHRMADLEALGRAANLSALDDGWAPGAVEAFRSAEARLRSRL